MQTPALAGKVLGNTINKLSTREEEEGEKKTKSILLNVPELISRAIKRNVLKARSTSYPITQK